MIKSVHVLMNQSVLLIQKAESSFNVQKIGLSFFLKNMSKSCKHDFFSNFIFRYKLLRKTVVEIHVSNIFCSYYFVCHGISRSREIRKQSILAKKGAYKKRSLYLRTFLEMKEPTRAILLMIQGYRIIIKTFLNLYRFF